MEHLRQAPIQTRKPQYNPNHNARFPEGIRLKHIPYLFFISETHKQRTCWVGCLFTRVVSVFTNFQIVRLHLSY